MIESLAGSILKQIPIKYPHMAHPAAMWAVITDVAEDAEKDELECEILDKETGDKKEAIISIKKYVYAVSVIDNDGMDQSDYPIFPNVISNKRYDVGDRVAIVFIGGELQPVIVGGGG